jgi:hypothetical protein
LSRRMTRLLHQYSPVRNKILEIQIKPDPPNNTELKRR